MIHARKHILITDDMEVNREIMGDLLREDYDISCAANGAEALEALRGHKDEIDLLLLDLEMPVKNGREVLAEMQVDEDLMAIEGRGMRHRTGLLFLPSAARRRIFEKDSQEYPVRNIISLGGQDIANPKCDKRKGLIAENHVHDHDDRIAGHYCDTAVYGLPHVPELQEHGRLNG
ncbi:MAG: response regulator [Clostridia bacterium]|nr:response regulator [Clostridia bacterium]